MEPNVHYVNAFSEYLLFLKEKYGDDWRDSMLTEAERTIIEGFRMQSVALNQ